MLKTYSIRPTVTIMSIIEEIKCLDRSGELSRMAIFERALLAAKKEKNWQEVYDTRIEEIRGVIVPESFQVRAEENEMAKIGTDILVGISDLKRLHTVVSVRLILQSYLLQLRRNSQHVGKKVGEIDITAPEMVAIFVDLLMKNRSCDVELIGDIKSLLIEWRSKIYSDKGEEFYVR